MLCSVSHKQKNAPCLLAWYRCSAEEAAEVEAALMERLSSATQSEEHRAKVVAGYNDFKEQFK
jgi:hypothetical protein